MSSFKIVACASLACAAVVLLTAAPGAAQMPAAPAHDRPATTTPAASVAPCPKLTEDLARQGKKMFRGGGNCYTCHGANAKGTPLAPNLTDTTWIQIDGSLPAIMELIRTGVPQPKQHPAPMPPMGGAQLSAAEVCALGAYVYSLSHGLTGSK